MKAVVRAMLPWALILPLALGVGAAARTVVDQTGATVRIEGDVGRVASAYGIGTYYVYALGLQDRLVAGWYIGLKSEDQASAAMRRLEPNLPSLMLFGDPNVEELARRGAEVVLLDASRHAGVADQLADLGLPAVQYRVETPEAMKEGMRLTADALGPETTAIAEAFAADVDRAWTMVERALPDLQTSSKTRVLFLGTSPLRVASGDMYQTRMIEAAGGVSVSAELRGYWHDVSIEQLLVWNPDVILIAPYGTLQPADLLENPDWASIRAVQQERVHRMPRVVAPMDTPVPDSLLGVLWMVGRLYPGHVSLDLADEAERFYTTYYGIDLTEEEKGLFVGQ